MNVPGSGPPKRGHNDVMLELLPGIGVALPAGAGTFRFGMPLMRSV